MKKGLIQGQAVQSSNYSVEYSNKFVTDSPIQFFYHQETPEMIQICLPVTETTILHIRYLLKNLHFFYPMEISEKFETL